MNANFIIRCLLLLLIPLAAAAQTTLKETTATGHGETYQEALAAALFNAVNQSQGVTVSSEKQLRIDLQQMVGNLSHSTHGVIGVEEKIFTLSKGYIDSYSVSSSSKPSGKDGTWAVTVKAKIPHHETSVSQDSRKRIAVMPFRFAHSTFATDIQGTQSSAYQLSQRMRDRILSNLTQSQQFLVLNRELNNDFASEKALLSSDNVPPPEASRLGQVAGADYMIVGNIHKLQTEAENKDYYGMKNTQMTDLVDLSYQLIEVASQKVEWADTIKTEVVRKHDESTDETLDKVAQLVTASVMDVLYPVKVLDVAGADKIYLNQGQTRLQVGNELALLTEGRTLTDPDTGIAIKVAGQAVAKLVVDQTDATYSVARLTEGSLATIRKGDIVRPISTGTEASAKAVRETPGSSDAPIRW